MAIQGHLKTIEIPELFSLLHRSRRTGLLYLVAEWEERVFVFNNGNLVNAMSSDSSRRLGNYLVRLGIVTATDLPLLLEKTVTGDGYFGEALCQTGRITEKQLQAAVREQVMDMLLEALTWQGGAFCFDDAEITFSLPGGFQIPTQGILLQVASMADERKRLKDVFPDLRLILAREPERPELSLREEEKQVLSLVDGKQTVETLFFAHRGNKAFNAATLKELLAKGAISAAGVRISHGGPVTASELHCLPVAPEAPGRILSVCKQREPSREDWIDVLTGDPTLVAKILRTVTLKNEELPRSNLKLEHLVETIGIDRLRSVLIPEAVRGLFFPSPDPSWKQCWEHAGLCARLSEQVATTVKYLYPGEAYLAGLLHNLGIFILMSRDPENYGELVRAAREDGQDLEALEEEHFGASHSRIGGMYAERWNFPRAVTLCIKHHHKCEDKAPNPLLNIVTVANGIAQEAGITFEPSMDAEARFEAALRQLNLNRRKAIGLLGKLHRRHPRPLSAVAAETAGAPRVQEI